MNAYHEGQPMRIGNALQLLIDDHMVEDRWRLTRSLYGPEKHPRNPILVRDKPWEGDMCYEPQVMWDGQYGRYRMWYLCFSTSNYFGGTGPAYYICHAESDDGFNWEKPLTGTCPLAGYEKTNVVYTGTYRERVSGVQVMRDLEETDPARRYKMVCLEARPAGDGFKSGVSMAYSADGFSWRLRDEEEHLLDYHSDGFNHIVYDEDRERWLLYCRAIFMYATGRGAWDLAGGLPGSRHMARRIAVATSKDCRRWSYPRTILYPDERDLPDYDQCRVFRCGSHFLMYYVAMEGDDEGREEVRLASSVDGISWERFHSREAYLGRGREGDWDGGQVATSCPPVQQGEKLLVYFTGTTRGQYDKRLLGGVGLAIAKVGRFVVHIAGDEPGFLLTREFILEGNRIRLNTVMRFIHYREMYVRVAIVSHPAMGEHPPTNGRGRPSCAYPGFSLEDCDPIQVDRTDVPVSWRGNPDVSALRGKPVYLRFEIRNMGLCAFQVTDE